MKKAIIWFRKDLRLSDNPALTQACEENNEIIPIYIYEENIPNAWMIGEASKWWLHYSLQSLCDNFDSFGIKLVLKKGNPLTILQSLLHETQANAVYWNRRYEPYSILNDAKIKQTLYKQGVKCNSYNGSLLIEPWEILTQKKTYFKVFTRFWNQSLKVLDIPNDLPIPELKKKNTAANLLSDNLNDWNLLPKHPNWAREFKKNWNPGEFNAQKKLMHFIENHLENYSKERDFPGCRGTSALSPHLASGEISPRQIWNAIKNYNITKKSKLLIESSNKYLAEIGWREFSYNLLYHFPKLPSDPFSDRFQSFPWKKNESFLKAWQKGLTGYPIVDAGMRQLWHIGWMHNRVRMIVASFLTKDLLINWTEGTKWFWDTLVDADLASNSASWQWVAGCGADAAPYFRIFNPVLQSQKFDPEGTYIRQWIPELTKLPTKYIHAPWETPEEILKESNIQLGINYPYPIIDHYEAKTKALDSFNRSVRNSSI